MKGQMIVSVALFAGATAAWAQSDSGSASLPPSAAPVNRAAAQATTLSTAPAHTTSTISLEAILKPTKPRPFKVDLYHRPSIKQANFIDQSGQVGSYNFIQAKYMLTETQSVGVRQEFGYKFAKPGSEAKATASDIFVSYGHSKIAMLPGGVNFSGNFRVYLPTGEDSNFGSKQKGALLAWLIASREFGKFELGYHFIPVVFNNSQDSYIDGGVEKANNVAEVYQFVDGTYKLTEKISLSQAIGTDNYWKKDLAGRGPQRAQALYIESIASYKLHDRLKLGASVINNANIWDSPNPFGVYRADETSYRLIVHANM